MEIKNSQLPCDKQDIDTIPSPDEYIAYLDELVDEGALSEAEAQELIDNRDWDKVEDLIRDRATLEEYEDK